MNTESFIEKIGKADVIQDLCEYKVGDYFYSEKFNRKYILTQDNVNQFPLDARKFLLLDDGFRWVPTFEELYLLLNDKSISVIYYFYEWIAKENQKPNSWVDIEKQSIKEFLLHFIMYEVFNRTWDSESRAWRQIHNG
jgi:hypothetical protein